MQAIKPGLCAYYFGSFDKKMIADYLYAVKNRKKEESDDEEVNQNITQEKLKIDWKATKSFALKRKST